MSNGKTDCSESETRRARTETSLDEYERSLGLPDHPLSLEDTALRYFQATPDELARMTAQECGEASVMLTRLAFHLQRAFNREQARARQADETVRRLIALSVGRAPGYSWEERKNFALAHHQEAREVDGVRVNAALRMDRIAHLSIRVGELSKTYLSLQASKRGVQT